MQQHPVQSAAVLISFRVWLAMHSGAFFLFFNLGYNERLFELLLLSYLLKAVWPLSLSPPRELLLTAYVLFLQKIPVDQ